MLEDVNLYQNRQENLKSCALSADQHNVLTPTPVQSLVFSHLIFGRPRSRFTPELPKYEFGKLQFRL